MASVQSKATLAILQLQHMKVQLHIIASECANVLATYFEMFLQHMNVTCTTSFAVASTRCLDHRSQCESM